MPWASSRECRAGIQERFTVYDKTAQDTHAYIDGATWQCHQNFQQANYHNVTNDEVISV